MQAIAREMNLSETAFILPAPDADFRCRYVMPLEEVPLAGHPTIASVHALRELGRIPAERDVVRLHLSAGVVTVEIRPATEGESPLIVMTQLPPEFGRRLNRGELAVALRVPESSVCADLPVQVVSTGMPQLMVPLASLTSLQKARPDAARVTELRAKGGFFSLHAFTLETLEAESAAHSRHWGVTATGLFEDPVTGSASGGMVAYLVRYGLLGPGVHRLEQGDVLQRPGRVHAEIDVDADDAPGPPRIGGQAVTVLRGQITVPWSASRAAQRSRHSTCAVLACAATATASRKGGHRMAEHVSFFRATAKPGQRGALLAQFEKWEREQKSKAAGFRRSMLATANDNADEVMGAVWWDTTANYFANAERPEQDAWYRELQQLMQGDAVWFDATVAREAQA